MFTAQAMYEAMLGLVDITMLNGGSLSLGWLNDGKDGWPRDVHASDVYRSYPYSNSICVLKMTAMNLYRDSAGTF